MRCCLTYALVRKVCRFACHFGVDRPGGQPQPVVKSAWIPLLKTWSGALARGLEAIASGYGLRFPDDLENLRHQFEVYDAPYAWCRLDVTGI